VDRHHSTFVLKRDDYLLENHISRLLFIGREDDGIIDRGIISPQTVDLHMGRTDDLIYGLSVPVFIVSYYLREVIEVPDGLAGSRRIVESH
tara:strand:+ start:1424 stop:1696 length:273 start_codon:yes stop_codon:yes gene_type:complete